MSKISLYFYPVIHTVTLVARITGTVSENIVSTCTIEEQLPSFSLFLEFKMFEFMTHYCLYTVEREQMICRARMACNS